MNNKIIVLLIFLIIFINFYIVLGINSNNKQYKNNKREIELIKYKEIYKKNSNLLVKSKINNSLKSSLAITTNSREKEILEILYNSWSGSLWENNDNWLNGDPCNNNWYGIVCDTFDNGTTYNIIKLLLSSNNLNGELPIEISELIHLQVLDLADNLLSGIIENETFQQMNNLTYLSINDNSFEGGLAWSEYLPENIITLWIAYNYFNSTIPIFYSKYKELDLLFLEGNLLYGSIPPEVGDIPKLRLVDFGFNNIEGQLPDNISNLKYLESLWLYDNYIEGTIPKSYGQLENLLLFELTRNNLTGTLDNIFTNTPKFTSVRFSSNKFYGSLQWICNITSLRDIALDLNEFEELPDCTDQVPLQLNDIILNNNKLIGTIPESMGNMIGLEYLNLAMNNITGSIPTSFKNITNFNRITIDNNNFKCSLNEILDPIKSQSHLTIISAQNNEIYGEFTESLVWDSVNQKELLTKVFIFNFKNNKLSGPLREFLSWMPNLNELDFSDNNFEGPIPGELNYLSTIYLENNPLLASEDGDIPPFMKVTDTFIHKDSEVFSCPQLEGNGIEMRISLDSTYYNNSYCKCDVNYRGLNGSCKLCPPNAVCSGIGNSILVPSGYFPIPSFEDPQYLLNCPISNFGSTSCNPENNLNFTCKEGYTGRLCSECKDNYFHKGMECSRCPTGWASTLIFVIVVIVFIILFLFFVMTDPKRSLPSSTRKTVMFYYQILNLLLSKLSPWPAFFSIFYSSSSWINFSFGFLCIGTLSTWPNLFIVIVCLPVIFFFLSIVFICLMQLFNYIKTKGNCKIDKNLFYSGIRVNLLCLNILYLPLTTYTFQNYPCAQEQYSGEKYMSFFPFIECGNNRTYNSIYRLTVASTIIYVIGIPALFAALLFYNKKRLDNPRILKMIGSIYIDYRKSVYYYELFAIARRFMLAVSLALIDPKSSFSVFVVLLVIGSSIISQIWFKPYVYKISNLAEVTGNSVLLFSYICILILSSLHSNKLYDSNGIEVILSVVVVIYTVLLGLLFFFSLKYYLPIKWQFIIDSKIIKTIEHMRDMSNKYLVNDRRVIDPDDSFETTKEPIFERTASSLHGIELKRRASQMSSLNTSVNGYNEYSIKVSHSHQQLSSTQDGTSPKFNSTPNLNSLTNNSNNISLMNLSIDNNNNNSNNNNNNINENNNNINENNNNINENDNNNQNDQNSQNNENNQKNSPNNNENN